MAIPQDKYNVFTMDTVQEKLDALLRRGAAQAGVELYHWELHGRGRPARLVVHVDRPSGVTVDDCARASQAIGALLDQEDPIPMSYELEVSSPGVERILWEPRHYAQAVGKFVQVEMRPGGRLRGRLVRIEGDVITLDQGEAELDIPLWQVARARVVYEGEREGR